MQGYKKADTPVWHKDGVGHVSLLYFLFRSSNDPPVLLESERSLSIHKALLFHGNCGLVCFIWRHLGSCFCYCPSACLHLSIGYFWLLINVLFVRLHKLRLAFLEKQVLWRQPPSVFISIQVFYLSFTEDRSAGWVFLIGMLLGSLLALPLEIPSMLTPLFSHCLRMILSVFDLQNFDQNVSWCKINPW